MVMEVVHEEIGESSAQCANHPYRNSAPGGICAFCLQEKLGKLVSASFNAPVFPASSSSSSPSFRSEFGAGLQVPGLPAPNTGTDCNNSYSGGGYCQRRSSKLPFVVKKKKKKDGGAAMGNSDPAIVFKRSKSTATPRRGMQFLDEGYSPNNRRGFWSFLYLSSSSAAAKHSAAKKPVKSSKDLSSTSAVGSTSGSSSGKKREEEFVGMDDSGRSPDEGGSIERKVSRSRSVGCGSRSFSGDFFERISTGFGDCTLRRVESHREGKQKMVQSVNRNNGVGNYGHDCIKERVRSCGGIFGGLMVASLSDLVESSSMGGGHLRSKSWGWAFASPMRAFGKAKRDASSSSQNKNAAPDLAALPSLLAVSG